MGSQEKLCAFCRTNNNLSREHVFPNGVIRKFETEMLSYNDQANKVFKSDLVVKDVCENCNNGALSEVDCKFVKLFEENMLEPLQPGDDLEFKFDYNDLLKALLKISFNSARASSDGFKAVAAMKKYAPYILGKVIEPPNIMIRLQIITSSKKLNTETNKVEGMLKAELLRSCKVKYNGPKHSNFMIRLVALNSFWFYVIFPLKPVSTSKMNSFLEGFLKYNHLSGVSIDRNMSLVNIPKEKTTYMHPQLLEGMPIK